MGDANQQSYMRRFPRIRSHNAVLVTKADANVEDLAATSSIGRGGCGFISQESFGVGAPVRLLISIHHQVVRATGRVAYEMPHPDGYDIGVEFVEIDPRELELIQELFESAKK